MRDVPFASIYFLSYEYGKIMQDQILNYIKLDDKGYTPSNLLAGACAGGIAATCTIPFDAGSFPPPIFILIINYFFIFYFYKI